MSDPFGLQRPGLRPITGIDAGNTRAITDAPAINAARLLDGEIDDAASSITYVLASDDEIDDLDQDITKITVCQTCTKPLNVLEDLDGTKTWQHTPRWEKHDHDPIPVRVERNHEVKARCDFCGLMLPIHWTYLSDNRVGIVDSEMYNDYGRAWGACVACDDIIQYTGDDFMDALADRCFEVGPLGRKIPWNERPRIRSEFHRLWSGLFVSYKRLYSGPKREPARLDPHHMPKYHRALINQYWKNPVVRDILVKDNPTARRVPAFCVDENTDQFMHRYPPGTAMTDDAFRRFRDHIIRGLDAAADSERGGLYWIAANHTRLAVDIAAETTELVINHDQLPSDYGLLIYEEPIGEIQRPGGAAAIRAISWTLVPDGIWICIYIQPDDALPPEIDPATARNQFGWLSSPNTGIGLRFGDVFPASDHPASNLAATIITTFVMMTQPGLTNYTLAPVNKKTARAFHRTHQRKLPDVRLVDLRRQPRRSQEPADPASTGRKLEYRVYRKTHQKMQAYGPKRGLRKLIIVQGYIAGPDDAPFKPKTPTVKVLR